MNIIIHTLIKCYCRKLFRFQNYFLYHENFVHRFSVLSINNTRNLYRFWFEKICDMFIWPFVDCELVNFATSIWVCLILTRALIFLLYRTSLTNTLKLKLRPLTRVVSLYNFLSYFWWKVIFQEGSRSFSYK